MYVLRLKTTNENRSTSYADVFSEFKRLHCAKYQEVILPTGITVSLIGPLAGRKHSARILRESRALDLLAPYLNGPSPVPDQPYVISGDPAYQN